MRSVRCDQAQQWEAWVPLPLRPRGQLRPRRGRLSGAWGRPADDAPGALAGPPLLSLGPGTPLVRSVVGFTQGIGQRLANSPPGEIAKQMIFQGLLGEL